MTSLQPPKLSIITVNLNNAAGLAKTLDSVRKQAFRDFEHIVIDGGSTDGSVDEIRARADGLADWVSEPDAGIYAAMNKGLRRAQGEYVQFLNSGDWLYDGQVLARVFQDRRDPEDLLYGDCIYHDPSGKTRRIQMPDPLAVSQFHRKSAIYHQAAFYRRSLFAELGFYNEKNRLVSDWEFNLRVLLANKNTRHLPFIVANYAGRGLSETQADRSLAEQAAVMQELIPPAIRRDYERLWHLEAECRRLREVEKWTLDIQERNPFANYAMATYWFYKRLKRAMMGRREPSQP